MIELERHIEILLLENDCVIVPDLGGFMAHHREACYDEEDHLFLPPQRTLGFNPQLKLNDSLLAQSYVEAYDISYPEAIRRIEAEVTELWQHLRNEGFYDLNDIGRLTFNDEGHIAFEPCEAGILTPELYGLSALEVTYLPNYVPAAKAKAANDTKQVDVSEPSDTTDRKEALTIPLAWVRNTVAIAAAILAFFVFTTPVSNESLSGITMSQVNLPLMIKDTNAKAAPATFDRQAIRKTITQKDTTIVDTIATPAAKPATPAPASTPYCIVLASQVSERNANEFVIQLQEKGIDARIYVHNSVRRVICGNYETEAEAYQALHDIHHEKGLAEAWVYKLKTES